MPLPIWIVGIADPAHAYMLRNGVDHRRRPRHSRHRDGDGFTGYVSLSSSRSDASGGPTVGELADLQARAEAEGRGYTARLEAVEARYGGLLRATARALAAAGTASIQTTRGDIQARIVRFRRGAIVLEVDYPGGRSQTRCSESTVGVAAEHQLASALASPDPPLEPLIDHEGDLG